MPGHCVEAYAFSDDGECRRLNRQVPATKLNLARERQRNRDRRNARNFIDRPQRRHALFHPSPHLTRIFLPMILKLLALSLILSATTFANSRGWPVKSELPEFLSVVADVPPIWGSADVVQSRCTFRVTLSNKRDTVLQLLNLNLVESRFMLIKADGTEVEWHIPKNIEGPGTNPGLTLGANSQIGFEIQMDRPLFPPTGWMARSCSMQRSGLWRVTSSRPPMANVECWTASLIPSCAAYP